MRIAPGFKNDIRIGEDLWHELGHGNFLFSGKAASKIDYYLSLNQNQQQAYINEQIFEESWVEQVWDPMVKFFPW